MSGNHTSTSNHNKEFLTKDLGLIQKGNSSIFENNQYFILSPSVQNKNNWFDIRKVNIDKKQESQEGLLIIRWINEFILIELDEFMTKLLDNEPYESTNSGIHWKFQIRIGDQNELYVLNINSGKKLYVEKITKDKLVSSIG